MSTNAISNNSVTYPPLNTETYESFQEQYPQYREDCNTLLASPSINELNNIKAELERLLQVLDNIVEDGYDPETVKKAMQALATLLYGKEGLMMSLEVRLQCLEKLLAAEGKMSESSYNTILEKLNNKDADYSEDAFLKDYYTALIKKLDPERDLTDLTSNELGIIYYTILIHKLDPNKQLTGSETLDELKEIYAGMLVGNDLKQSQDRLNEARGKSATTAASLALKVIQANHQFKELDLQNISDEKQERDAEKNPMIKKLKNEGIWEESTVDRRQKMIEEEKINELRNQNRK